MADPVTIGLAALTTATTIGSTIIGAKGQAQTAGANVATANYQAQVSQNNQVIAEQNARYAEQAGRVNAQAQDFKTRALLGQESAAAGASGIDLTTGSPADVRSSTERLGRLDTMNVIQGAELTAYGYRTQGTSFAAESGLERLQAQYAAQAGTIGVAGTILGGATGLSSKWLQYQQAGIFGGGNQDYSSSQSGGA